MDAKLDLGWEGDGVLLAAEGVLTRLSSSHAYAPANKCENSGASASVQNYKRQH